MRKEKIITISKGRDAGKKFKVQEMGALKIERWATRAMMLLAGSGIDLGVDKDKLKGVEGWSNIAKAGISKLSEIDFEKVEPLLKELLECCYFIADNNIETQLTYSNVESIVEDMSTLFLLRQEAFGLHFGFFPKKNPSE